VIVMHIHVKVGSNNLGKMVRRKINLPKYEL